MSCQSGNIDLTSIKETEFNTGTPIKRALIFKKEEAVIFLSLSAIQLSNYENISAHIREKFNGDFTDFYFSAYKEYIGLQNVTSFEKANVPSRMYADLLRLIDFSRSKPSFMQKDGYRFADLIEDVCKITDKKLRAFGLKIHFAHVTDTSRDLCRANICITNFLFLLFRLIYIGFKLSSDGNLEISLHYLPTDRADICISTKTNLPGALTKGKLFSSLIKFLPEFSFEHDILEKCGCFKHDILSYEHENSILKLHFKIKCDTGESFFVRSESASLRKKRISKNISELLHKPKKLLSKNK
jgi:hypothetical protein